MTAKKTPPKRRKPGVRRADRALGIYLDAEQDDRLRAFVARAGRPLSAVVRDAVAAYLEAVEPSAAGLESLRRPTLSAPILPKHEPAGRKT